MRFDQEHDSCTTILVGKKASYDGSTLVARTEDSCNGEFTPKKFIVVRPEDNRVTIKQSFQALKQTYQTILFAIRPCQMLSITKGFGVLRGLMPIM